jgi:phosphate/sulfate permease
MPKKIAKKKTIANKKIGGAQSARSMSAQSQRMLSQALTEITGMPVSFGKGKVSGSNYTTTNPRNRGR